MFGRNLHQHVPKRPAGYPALFVSPMPCCLIGRVGWSVDCLATERLATVAAGGGLVVVQVHVDVAQLEHLDRGRIHLGHDRLFHLRFVLRDFDRPRV